MLIFFLFYWSYGISISTFVFVSNTRYAHFIKVYLKQKYIQLCGWLVNEMLNVTAKRWGAKN
jgi:hypothetical protein